MSDGQITESSRSRTSERNNTASQEIGYIYQHTPIELFIAHGLTPTLVSASSRVSGGFESSLQTFACAYSRNIFSQRANGQLNNLRGIVFPSNTCDSLQNVGDVWKHRFPEDNVFRLTYPAGKVTDAAIKFFSEELRLLNEALTKHFGTTVENESITYAIDFVKEWRIALQLLYSIRLIHPASLSYTELGTMLKDFFTNPTQDEATRVSNHAKNIASKLKEKGLMLQLNDTHMGLLNGSFKENVEFEFEESPPRIIIAGGMIEPKNIAAIFNKIEESHPHILLTDLLSLGFKIIFTPSTRLDGDPYVELARAYLHAPLEPTQEGLDERKQFLREILTIFKIDGLIIAEQSFCDPDQFEAPSLESVAKDVGVKSIRLPMDPEFSDQQRMTTRLESFIETLGGS